jgi:O-methyltransferase
LKSVIRALIGRLPTSLQRSLHKVHVALFHRHLLPALRDYTYSDEKLKFVHILECMNYVRIAGSGGVIPPVYFEFGCHSGRTFSAAVRAARYLDLPNAQFYAFDSFEGLPPTDASVDGAFVTGSFATSKSDFLKIVKRNTGLELDASHVTKGFYSDSLTPQLQARMPKVGVVHIDVDLYSSTVEVLRFIKPSLVVGTVLVFDDWYAFPPGTNRGEERALREFCEQHPAFAIEAWKSYSTFGKSFIVTALP